MKNINNNEPMMNDEPNVMRGVFYGLIFEAIGICTIWGLVKIILLFKTIVVLFLPIPK